MVCPQGSFSFDNEGPTANMIIGWLSAAKRKELQGTTSNITRIQAVGGWQNIGVEEEMSDMFWQYGFSGYSYGKNNDDGFTIYLEEWVIPSPNGCKWLT